MDKRRFLLAAAAIGGALPIASGAAGTERRRGAPLLTVAGAILRSNRGALDPALDQLMVKHGATFDRAFEFDAAMLERLPAVTIRPTLEYDAKPHRLAGPLLERVVAAAGVGAAASKSTSLTLRALDGYSVTVALADAARHRMVLATRVDGAPMGLGGLGPVWAVHDADRIAEFRDKPLKERFALCPWGLYYIEVKAG